jgi:hypothetical protein
MSKLGVKVFIFTREVHLKVFLVSIWPEKVDHNGDRVFSLFYFVFLDPFFVVDKLVFKGFRGVY